MTACLESTLETVIVKQRMSIYVQQELFSLMPGSPCVCFISVILQLYQPCTYTHGISRDSVCCGFFPGKPAASGSCQRQFVQHSCKCSVFCSMCAVSTVQRSFLDGRRSPSLMENRSIWTFLSALFDYVVFPNRSGIFANSSMCTCLKGANRHQDSSSCKPNKSARWHSFNPARAIHLVIPEMVGGDMDRKPNHNQIMKQLYNHILSHILLWL